MTANEVAVAAVIGPTELEVLMTNHPEVRLLDVRTPGEHETAHIRGSYNVPLDTLGEHARDIQASVGEPVVLICQTGGRARQAEAAVNPLFALLPLFVGGGLSFAGITDTCAMGMLLTRLPYNRPATCDIPAMVHALKTGSAPSRARRATLSESPPRGSCAA